MRRLFHRVRSWLRANAMPGVYRLSERVGFHVYPVHYYSPLPSLRELEQTQARWSGKSQLPGLELRLPEQLALVETLKAWQAECEALPAWETLMATGPALGPGYGEIEALLLHAMIRQFKPRRIIEVGSGYSSRIASDALALNPDPGALICIEPFPYPALRELSRISQLVEQRVQEVELDFFNQLGENDILFIDSSHIVKVGGDVVYLFLEVLPRLRPGVIVHVHDIGFPYWHMKPTQCLTDTLFPTEGFLIQAFLAFNATFNMLLCSSYLHFEHPAALSALFPRYDSRRHLPSSLWIQRAIT